MKLRKKIAFLLACAMSFSVFATGCGKTADAGGDSAQVSDKDGAGDSDDVLVTETAPEASQNAQELTEKPEGNFIELALNVYYNDSESNYFSNEAGQPIYVTEEGQYTLTFDCATDLSSDATSNGVRYLKNLTAVYILDMGAANGEQSPLKGAQIQYDAVEVDGVALTVTQTGAKSAFKSSGLFDTNDPINAWDGSCVEEVLSSDDHVANFTTVDNPTTISVTFTLSDLDWTGEEAAETTDAAGSGYTNTAVFSDMDFTDMDALTLTKYLGNGINLGNTMEAYGHATLGTSASVSNYETYWGQPVTTAEMVQGMKDCGFDTLRIPVAWTNMMDYESGDYTINTEYLDRVEEIVNYALDAEMFVVLNDHWDGGWWAMFGSSDETSAQNAFDMYESLWTQIAERFKDYSDMLIFESANEELGDGLNDNSDWPDSGSLTTDQCYALTNEINQRFVDVVRSTGGNNDDRFLLIAGYNTDFDMTVDDRFEMPSDSATGKLFLSVHYYTPWNYCGAENDSRWGTKDDYALMDEQFAKIAKFTEAGYGVIIGEYGALPVYDSATGTSTAKQNTTEFTKHLLDLCDLYNYCPLLWSTNDSYNKSTETMITDELTQLFTSRCYVEETAAGDSYLSSVQASLDEDEANAIDMWEDVSTYEAGTPVAWIMWNGGAGTYSVGDVYNPSDNTEGITAHDVVVDGAGEYTVSLDFAGGNTGVTFAALAIADGELLYPGCIIDIKEITLDGNPITLQKLAYTSSDDGICTRVNLYNEWVKELPDDARNKSGQLGLAGPCIIDKTELNDVKNITITFELIVP
jgi:endoglucanase